MIKQYELKPLDGERGTIYIGIPRERIYLTKFVDNRDALLQAVQATGRGTGYYQAEGHRVDRNRDAIVEQFLSTKGNPQWLVMIDTDMEHPVNAPMRLTSWSQPIVGGLYFHRGESHDPFVFRNSPSVPDKYGRVVRQWAPMRDVVYKFLVDHQVPMQDGALTIDNCQYTPLVECDAVATGCMAIHRSVFETMNPPWFEYRPHGNSEDLVFCAEAKEDYGIPIYCDLSVISGHFNWTPMGHAQFRLLYEARGINFTNYSKGEAADWLSVFLKISKDAAVEKIEQGNAHMVGDYWNARFDGRTPTSDEIAKFYADPYTGQLYLIELLHWNFSQVFFQLRSKLMRIRDKKVIEIGSGIGTVAIQLCLQGNEVVAVEPNKLLRDFTNYRYSLTKKEVATEVGDLYLVNDEWKKLDDCSVDVVVALDVFEHLDAETLQQMLHDIARVLKVGGHITYHANWQQQDLYPMHFNHAEFWDAWLIREGFTPLSQMEALKVR